MSKLLLALATTTAGWLAMSLAAAEPAGAAADEQTIKEELTAREDPTILSRRAWLETEWNHFEDDSDDVELTLGGTLGLAHLHQPGVGGAPQAAV